MVAATVVVAVCGIRGRGGGPEIGVTMGGTEAIGAAGHGVGLESRGPERGPEEKSGEEAHTCAQFASRSERDLERLSHESRVEILPRLRPLEVVVAQKKERPIEEVEGDAGTWLARCVVLPHSGPRVRVFPALPCRATGCFVPAGLVLRELHIVVFRLGSMSVGFATSCWTP